MSNVETVEELYRIFRGRDYGAFAAICAPDVEWLQNDGFPGGGRHVGAEAIVENVFKGFAAVWKEFGYEIEQYFDTGEAVLVVGHYVGRHGTTGRPFRAAAAHLYELQDGRLFRYRQFADTKTIWDAMP